MGAMIQPKKKATDTRASVGAPAFRGARHDGISAAHRSGRLAGLALRRRQCVQQDSCHTAGRLTAPLLDVGQRLRREAHGATDVNE